jgi:hypothetical protein
MCVTLARLVVLEELLISRLKKGRRACRDGPGSWGRSGKMNEAPIARKSDGMCVVRNPGGRLVFDLKASAGMGLKMRALDWLRTGFHQVDLTARPTVAIPHSEMSLEVFHRTSLPARA